MIAGTPHVDDWFAHYPSLRARVEELERRLSRQAPDVAARVMADLTSGSRAGQAPGSSAEQPLVIRSIIDLVEGRSLRIGHELSGVLGVSEQELMQSSFLERVHPEDRLRTMRVMGRLAGGQVLEGFRIRHRHADGTYLVFEWAAVADDAGELCYGVAIVFTG
ncbi:MAG: PAS domain-containing protein [Acidobacteriota bacterium]|nr:PAS domain-containing protein [Acidobacteriota bacterium]